MFKAAGGTAGAASYLAVIDESKIEQLPPQEQHQARLDMLASLIGQSALGPIGVDFERAGPAEIAGKMLKQGVREAGPGLERSASAELDRAMETGRASGEQAPAFDPSKPFEVVEETPEAQTAAAPAAAQPES